MADIKYNQNNDGTGTVPFEGGRIQLATGSDAIIQRIYNLLGTHEGEIPYDTTRGIPWLEILRQDDSITGIVALIQSEIEDVEGVEFFTDRAEGEIVGKSIALKLPLRVDGEDIVIE